MIEEVYDYLREYGFSKEEVNSFQDENEEMFFTNLEEIEKNINFLINKELSKEETLEVIRKDPYMLTVKNNRLDYLEKIYNDILKLNNVEIHKLMINNPDAYIISPIELEKIISYLKDNNYNIDKIKELILNNPETINLTLEEFEESYR
ncbi:MAG: hypothetical protein E7172_05145 [Firmicutes bacterium]|nr:hypothetical protein [Bacillota bacterium]